jgi:hypothetical protein
VRVGDSGDPSYAAHYEVVKQALPIKERKMKKTIVIILTALALIGCRMVDSDDGSKTDDPNTEKPGDPNTDDPDKEKPSNNGKVYTKELWGEWLRMDTGDTWYISDNAVTINGAEASTSATLTKQSDRVIEVTDGGRKYYLYASRTATASFTGVIAMDAAGSARAASRGRKVTAKNQNNEANESSAVTDEDGKFTVEGVILGDPYQVIPEGGTPVTITPKSDGGDVGVITVTTGVNFKTALIPTQSSTDMTELYMNEAYQFEIEFENVGDEDCPSPSYTITEPSGVTITGTLQGILGTIEPGVKKSVPISVRCSTITSDHEYKKISIRIADAAGKTWDDSVSLRFYKETMGFNIKAEKPISGIIISPDTKTYSFTDVTNGTVVTPRRVSGNYLVVFSGATIETETSYSLGIGTEAEGDFSAFFETGKYEQNDTEDAAVSLSEQKIMAYLYKNDIDYYRVFYGSFKLPPAPTNVSASAADAQVTVSWATVTEAESYNVYRSDSQTGTYTKIGAPTTASYVDTVAAVGTYYYKASAVSMGDLESSHSTPITVAVTPPAVPTNVSASAADAQVTVSWNAVTGAKSYNIYRAVGSTETYTKVSASTSSPYTETIDTMGTYYYEVSAVSMGGLESGHSTPAEIAVTIEIDVTSLSETLAWLSANTVNSGHYILLLGKDETISAQPLTYSGMDVTVILKGKGGERTVSLSGNGSLFTVESGVMLVLEDGVTLKGHSSNTDSLVRVNSGGNLVLKDGAKISGNTNTGSSSGYSVGGVYVGGDGTFTMSGGEISGNTTSSIGGGVYVSGDGTFTMSGGEISGNTAFYFGGGVCVFGGTFTMSGGEISGNTASSSSYSGSSGGGVCMSGGMFTMSGGTVSGNTASYFGGGVLMDGDGTFTKHSGGIIYGSNATSALQNTVTRGNNYGHTVYVFFGNGAVRKRDTTVGVGVTLDSRTSGGWE